MALEQPIGRVLVVGDSRAAAHFEHEYRGFAAPGQAGTEVVRCSQTADAGGVVLSIEAGQAGASTPGLSARFRVPKVGPAVLEAAFSETSDDDVRVRLGSDAFQYFEYAFGSDDERVPSFCSVTLDTFDADLVTGKAVCRRLVATAGSADAVAQGGAADLGPATASATLDFSCPFHVLAAPGGGGGQAGSGGSGGAVAQGGSGGSSVAGSSVGGTGGPSKRCAGVNTPCSLRGTATCELGLGCTLDENCEGFVGSCYSQFSVYSCTALEGCFWASSSKKCSGSSRSCSSFAGPASCGGQDGCSWTSDCTGTAPLCSDLSEGSCGLEPGCRWE